jgi:cell division transport system permease protein
MSAVRTSWKHIRRNPYQALAAICIMFLTFLSISVFAFIVFGSSVVIQYFESKPQVTAFFKDEAQQSDIDALKSNLEQSGHVGSIRYVSKKEALQIYKQQNKNDPLLLDLVTEDILPSSLEISTNKIEEMGPVSELLKNSPVVSEVVYQKDVISTLTRWTNALRIIGITLIAVLSVVSIFIMMTVIGFKVSQKKEEIEIMRLLSATNWYIRWPFVFEGIFYGVIGTFLGWLIASCMLLYATPYLESFLKGIPLLPISPIFLLELLAGELVIAVVLGVLASSLAVLRYLK